MDGSDGVGDMNVATEGFVGDYDSLDRAGKEGVDAGESNGSDDEDLVDSRDDGITAGDNVESSHNDESSSSGDRSTSSVEGSSSSDEGTNDESSSSSSSSSSSRTSTSSTTGGGDDAGGNLPFSPYDSSDGGRSSDSDGDSEDGDLPPWLEDEGGASAADEGRATRVVDGGAERLRFTPEGMSSKWRPYPTLTYAILASYIRLASLTRAHQKLLFSCLRYTDEDGNGLNPADIPACADHFERDARLLTPLLPVTEVEIEDKNGFTTSVVGFSPAALLQRRLESPDAAAGILANLEGHVLTSAEREVNGVSVEHLTPVATKPAGGRRRGFLHGKIAAASALMGLESLRVGPSGRMEEIFVGETVMVASADGRRAARPHRLAQVVWVKDRSLLVPRVSSFLTTTDARIKSATSQRGGAPEVVWEVVDDNGGEEVAISRILGRCDIVRFDQQGGARSPSSRQVFTGAGFIKRAGNGKYSKIWCPSGRPRVLPWRFEGLDGLFFNRRAPGVHSNTAGLPVFNIPLVVFTDAFNFFQRGGSPYSINATHFTIGSTTRAFRRRLSSWDLCRLGAPRARWEEELDSLFETLGKMQNGCRARVCINGETVVVFLRAGVVAINADSPVQRTLCNCKRSGSGTYKPCNVCNVTQNELGDGQFDFASNMRTMDGIDHSLELVRRESTKTKQREVSTQEGVVGAFGRNPVREHLHLNTIKSIGVDILHQDALNSYGRAMKTLVDGLSPAGKALMAARVKDSSLRTSGSEPLKDIRSEGGWASQNASDLWRLAGVSLLLYRAILADTASMKRYMRAAFVGEVGDRLGPVSGHQSKESAVLDNLRALLYALSEASHCLRLSSFGDEDVQRLMEVQREKVDIVFKVLGDKLGTIHQGLHIPGNIEDLGDTINVNTGESLHKQLKYFAKLSKGTDNTLLIARRVNTRMAATAMMEGVEWSARRYGKKQGAWVTERIKASPACRQLLRTLLDSSTVSRKHGVGRVRRTVEWSMIITNKGKSISAASNSDAPWIHAIARASKGFNLDALYRRWYSCGRQHGEETPCGGLRCMRCWKFRRGGFRQTEARCFNNWAGAPKRASGGSRTVRGCPVELALPNNRRWMFAPYPCGTDVEIYFTPAALAARRPGPAGICTLGKVAFFIEHAGNPPQGEDKHGESTVWVVVAEYVTAAVGQSKMTDAATGHPVMRLRESLSFFPAEAIRRVVQMHHACATGGGCKAVPESNKAPVWKHKLSPGDNFLYNEHFHSVL